MKVKRATRQETLYEVKMNNLRLELSVFNFGTVTFSMFSYSLYFFWIVHHSAIFPFNNTMPFEDGKEPPWYLKHCYLMDTIEVVKTGFNWMILYSYLIPISLFVSMEILRFLSSMQFRYDIQMQVNFIKFY